MSWKDIVKYEGDKESGKNEKKINFIIRILEAHKDDFENSKNLSFEEGSDIAGIRQAIQMIEDAIDYANEIKEELQ